MSLGLREYNGKKIQVQVPDMDPKEDFNREEWRQEKIDRILKADGKWMFKHLEHLVEIVQGEFILKVDKIKDLDDVALTFINTLLTNKP